MRRVVSTPRSPFRLRRGIAPALLAMAATFAVATGCAGAYTSASPPETGPTTPEVASITETQLSGDQLVRVTGTVLEAAAPGCLLLETGTTRYLLIGGDPEVLEPDETVTVTGNANPQTPTPCTGGTPLTVTEAVAAE